jgi:hypothetical protein
VPYCGQFRRRVDTSLTRPPPEVAEKLNQDLDGNIEKAAHALAQADVILVLTGVLQPSCRTLLAPALRPQSPFLFRSLRSETLVNFQAGFLFDIILSCRTGAGYSSDSGLPVYKDIASVPAYREAGLSYQVQYLRLAIRHAAMRNDALEHPILRPEKVPHIWLA